MNAYTRHRAPGPGGSAATPPPLAAPDPSERTEHRHAPDLLGHYVSGQLGRLCEVAGIDARQRTRHQRVLSELLGPAAALPMGGPPPSPSFVSDDHSPVEFSLTFPAGAAPVLRVLVDPGSAARSLRDNARTSWAAVGRLAAQEGFGPDELTRLSDLFLPPAPHGPLTLWCALELRPAAPPGVKLYLNPGARGAERGMETVTEAMSRLGHARAFEPVRRHVAARSPERAGFMFFALDVGPWTEPRVKVYVVHPGATAADAADAVRPVPGACPERVADLCRLVAGEGPYDRLPLVSCYSFTGADTHHPTGHALHVPVRAYVRDDRVARDRAVRLLRQYGVGAEPLDRALAALTARPLTAGVGLISYLSLVQAGRQAPRITTYFSSEAYRVLPPRQDTAPRSG
ncbi:MULTISPECIES: tryptophan dimethylallyltransferase family protein [Streptomyces]|uniref:tryptophan dimethylallyltransferase family protein n=1 Tax=Streptomyces TaxID=1883 RepID=UPI0006977338|nr:tryptophan dimethylallyltransferase family protein [Streptomyces sp. FxanaA7]